MKSGSNFNGIKDLKALLEEKLESEEDSLDKYIDEGINGSTDNKKIEEMEEKVNFMFSEGVRYLKEKDYIEALGFFKAVLCFKPEHTKAMNNLALTLYNLGFTVKAVEVLKTILKKQPDNETAKLNLSIIEGVFSNGR